VFGTRTGGKIGTTNVRKRVLVPALEAANIAIAKRDLEPCPRG
jgi:hypothetical protein